MSSLSSDLPSRADVRRYLVSLGWEARPHPNSRIELFEKADGNHEVISIVIPSYDDASNERQMLEAAMGILAEHQRVPSGDLSNMVLDWHRDVLTVRIFDYAGGVSSLPLTTASDTLIQLKNLMGYTAYTEQNPQPFFEKAGGVSAEFSAQCRFGHTFRGSFGIRIEVPFDYTEPLLPMDGNPSDPPFERLVTERLAAGLNSLREASEVESIAPLVDGFLDGFSANMLWTLVGAYDGLNGARIEYDLKWSGQLRSEYEEAWKPFVFEGRAFEFARKAAKELEKVTQLPEHVVVGHVTALKSDMPPGLDEQQEFEHIVTMYWEKERGNRVRIRVPLNPVDYMAACDAHKDGRKVRVFGYPEKTGKFWVLNRAHGFSAHV
jgi:hypothetical protein